jgi:hypothetical protein
MVPTTPGPASTVRYSNLLSEFDGVRKVSARAAAVDRTTQNIPTSGRASFSGATSFSEHAGPTILAKTDVGINFATSTVGGKLSNFRSIDGTIFNGEINLSNGRLNSETGSVTGNISGNLTSDSRRMSTVSATGQVDARLIGDNHNYLRGPVTSMWTTNAGQATMERTEMNGEMALAKQY